MTGITPQTSMYGTLNPMCFAPEEIDGHKNVQDVPVESQENFPYPNKGGVANITELNQLMPTNAQYNRACSNLSEIEIKINRNENSFRKRVIFINWYTYHVCSTLLINIAPKLPRIKQSFERHQRIDSKMQIVDSTMDRRAI